MKSEAIQLEDYAAPERQAIIIASNDEALAQVNLRLLAAIERAVWWLDNCAPERARDELLEATKE